MIKKWIFGVLILLFTLLAFQSSSIYEDTTVPSYDTTFVEGVDTVRQIYICDRKKRIETFILIKNDSVLLWDADKY